MFINQKVSLEDILGKDYIGALCAANSALGMMDAEEAAKIASEKIDFYSEEVQKKNDELLSYVGKPDSSRFHFRYQGCRYQRLYEGASDPDVSRYRICQLPTRRRRKTVSDREERALSYSARTPL